MKILSVRALMAMEDEATFIPEHTRQSVIDWIDTGYIDVDDFLYCLIANDLKATFMVADNINRHHVRTIVTWFYQYAPSMPVACWGSPEAVGKYREWLSKIAEEKKNG